ncbi:MAG: carbohydrate kinase family protein [Candidatus Pacebacteria bacterium]|nr:carbohydrate kinase family protein [Candidatus Paceibacterota bacterium]
MFGLNKKFDFLAIGDVVIDAFIRIKDAEELTSHGTAQLCVRFGDKVPYESVTVVPAVGNGPNAAVSAARLGLSSAIVTHIGDDRHGEECLSALEKEKIGTKYVEKQNGKHTNYHYVLWHNVDRTILVKHTDFDYKLPKKLPEVKWLYLTSLADNTLPYHAEIVEYLKQNPNTKLAFQPGTFQIKTGAEKLKDLYTLTEIFFCNLEEAQTITGIQSKDVLILSKAMKALGPKMVAISDGPNGAHLYHNDELWKIPIYTDIAPPVDRTGAGDAFASTMTVALALGKTPVEALTWGPVNSMSVVQEIGAQKGLLSRAKLEEYLTKAPADYKATKIN